MSEMFYCDDCAKKNSWPHGWPRQQSHGPCEICGKVRVCTDTPSYALPERGGKL